MASDAHDKLVESVGKAPSREWIDEFFDLLNDLLSYEDINRRDDDDRLVTSVRPDRIAVTMNSRYVLVAFLAKERIGFLVRNNSAKIADLIEGAEGHYSFDALQTEHESETPDWVEYTDVSEHLADDAIRQNWLTASSIEFDRWSASPSKNAHEPLVVKASLDKDYRSDVLDDAFASS